jgi:hypothetical protein
MLCAQISPSWAHIVLIVLGVGAVLVVALLFFLLRWLFGGKKRKTADGGSKFEEKLGTYPPLQANSADRRLLVEGIPVRLRLVVIAPAGTDADVDEDEVEKLLDRLLPGLGAFCKQDKARVRMWPMQISAEGFVHQFNKNTVIPEGEKEESPWVCLAGRVKAGKYRVMLGLALQGMKPNTIGRRTLEADEWATALRIRVRSEA